MGVSEVSEIWKPFGEPHVAAAMACGWCVRYETAELAGERCRISKFHAKKYELLCRQKKVAEKTASVCLRFLLQLSFMSS